jgi:hypothetical protein
MAALSGGRGGSRNLTPGWIAWDIVNNPYMTGLEQIEGRPGHVYGGPIPIGPYIVSTPSYNIHVKGMASALTPGKHNTMMHRSGGFLIHGRGPKGSAGCIVPMNPGDFEFLMNALAEDGGGTLQVLPSMIGDFG